MDPITLHSWEKKPVDTFSSTKLSHYTTTSKTDGYVTLRLTPADLPNNYGYKWGDDSYKKEKEMEKKFKIGDVVQLNSGSVNMTVVGFGFLAPEGDTVKCVWYNELNCEFKQEEIRENILRLVRNKED